MLTNRKASARKGKVQLIDATSFWAPMGKSLGDKRREVPLEREQDILALLDTFADGESTMVVKDGNPEADPELRDTESVPLPPGDDPVDEDGVSASVRAFFEREVKPHVPDAWIDLSKRDSRDGLAGVVGYEINFNRHFYRYTPPRPLEEIEADIREIGADIVRMLGEITESAVA